MDILLTGAFGNVGLSTLDELLAHGHKVRIIEMPTKRNLELAKLYPTCEIMWGDIRKYDDVAMAAADEDAIVHVAAIIPPMADRMPEKAYDVNVGGTSNIIKAAYAQSGAPRIFYTSSVSIYGDRLHNPEILAGDMPNPNNDDEYAKQKLEAEQVIRHSGLEFAILRLSYVVSPNRLAMDPLMFHMPLDTSLEPCDTKDVGTALAHAVTCDDCLGRTLLIAGGEGSRISYRDYLDRMTSLFGLGTHLLPDRAFAKSGFHCGFMDTAESQRLLKYQNHGLEDYFKEAGKKVRLSHFFLMIGGGLSRAFARNVLLRDSMYMKNKP